MWLPILEAKIRPGAKALTHNIFNIYTKQTPHIIRQRKRKTMRSNKNKILENTKIYKFMITSPQKTTKMKANYYKNEKKNKINKIHRK